MLFRSPVVPFPSHDKARTKEYGNDIDVRVHPTQKPLLLMDYLVKTYSNENDIILDFACGSGTTGVSALNNNRKFIGIEMNKEYFDISNDRISHTICSSVEANKR